MKRPLRSLAEKATDNIPRGPLGIAGKGNLIGGAGYFTVATVNGVLPVDGVKLGFEVESHNVDRMDNKEVHTFVIHSASKDVARFIAKYKSSPSNIQFVGREIKITDVNEEKSNKSFSRWRVRTEVEGRTTDSSEL